MNVIARPGMTIDEFLVWEARQERKWEFDGRGPVEMPGVTENHSILQSNLAFLLVGRLRGTGCRYHGSDMQLRAGGRIRYPDGQIVRSARSGEALSIDGPVVVFEILSRSSQYLDRYEKNAEYRSIASVARYVMLEQDQVAATVFERAGDDWVGHTVLAGEMLRLPEVGVEFAIAELYEGVALQLVQGSELDQ